MRNQDRSHLLQRLGFLHRAVHVVFLVIALGYAQVQIVQGARYRELADNNRLRKVLIEAPRGQIVDRAGRILVENVPSYNLLIDRSLSRDPDASLAFAAKALDQTFEDLVARMDEFRSVPRFRPVRLAERLTLQQVARLNVEHLEHPEFEIEIAHQRLYRQAHLTAHLLGYLGEVDEADLADPETPYRLGDQVGKKGVESLLESSLRGEQGEQVVVVDSRGRLIEELERVPARPGHNVALALDLELQMTAARLMEEKVGAIVAIDPRNGDVLAMYSSPSYDPNLFARGIRREEWRELMENPGHPLQNRAIQNTFPPGSVYKFVVALAALDRGLINAQTSVFCSGTTTIYDRSWRCWNRHGHGQVNVVEALRGSCDIFFYHIGPQIGIDTLAEYSRRFGLGRPTGIDLDGERGGLVPDNRWSLERRKAPWYPGETISVMIGQGPILVTPLQVASLMGTMATGRSVRPRIVLDQPIVFDEPLPFRKEHLRLVREGLAAVVNDPLGTGKTARPDEMIIAGKTGTVQVIAQETWTKNDELAPKHRDHAWFAGWGPVEDPRIAVAVFVEHGGGGSVAAAPLAKEIFNTWWRLHSETEAEAETETPSAPLGSAP